MEQPKKPRKKPTEKSAVPKKRKKSLFEIDLNKSLTGQIQEWIDSEWKGMTWTESTANKTRYVARNMLKNAYLALNLIKGKDQLAKVEMMSWAIEQSVYDNWFTFQNEKYSQTIRRLTSFIAKRPIVFMSIDPCYIATMHDRDLVDYQPESVSTYHEEFMKKNVYGASDIVCPVCLESNAENTSSQMRRADEPRTEFYECRECGKRWKEN
jgi:DNA-directed RNA polymerase subunit M/transcription elongation factor TFIIS